MANTALEQTASVAVSPVAVFALDGCWLCHGCFTHSPLLNFSLGILRIGCFCGEMFCHPFIKIGFSDAAHFSGELHEWQSTSTPGAFPRSLDAFASAVSFGLAAIAT